MPADNMQENMAANPSLLGMHEFSFHVNLANVTAAAMLSSFVPGYKFAIKSVRFAVETAVTTAAKAATLTPTISGATVTGGVLALTSANCTPKGVIVSGTSVTGANRDNEGSETDSVTVTASSVTAFVEGQGELVVTLLNREV